MTNKQMKKSRLNKQRLFQCERNPGKNVMCYRCYVVCLMLFVRVPLIVCSCFVRCVFFYCSLYATVTLYFGSLHVRCSFMSLFACLPCIVRCSVCLRCSMSVHSLLFVLECRYVLVHGCKMSVHVVLICLSSPRFVRFDKTTSTFCFVHVLFI